MPTLKISKTLTATPLILPKTRTSCQRIAMAGSQQVVLVGLGLAIFMMPGQLQLIGQYQTARGLGKVERLWDIFLHWLLFRLRCFLMPRSFMSMPIELEDAAHLDGCSPWQASTLVTSLS